MKDPLKAVADIYDRDPDYEWQRLERHRTEYEVTLWAMEKYLPPPPARVLDCGGGPGRYAIELARRGYQVVLFDLSAVNLNSARQQAAQAGVTLQAFEQGDARDLSRFAASSFDAVLLMGPLYHLLAEEDRLQALREAYRVLKPGGPLLAAFISRYAAHRELLARQPELILEEQEDYQRILETGQLPPAEGEGPSFVAYFAHPKEVAPLLQAAEFEVQTVLGVEGLAAELEEKVNQLQGEAWQTWLTIQTQVANDPSLLSGADHLLAVVVKPRWRIVLRRLAALLEQHGLDYKVVGGTVAALYGLPTAVRDLDIEMNEAGVYSFQELFAAQATMEVAWREDERYRSYFGRYDFDEVQVEVMAGLERRQGKAWRPTQTSTRAVVDLEGQPVNVPWLEEETLAYIRRGKLERAALCLPHCNPVRIQQLFLGEVPSDVL